MGHPEDKRQFYRAGVTVPIRFRPPGTTYWKSGAMIDIGAGGLRFATPELCEMGQQLEFQIELPIGPAPSNLKGTLLWERIIPGGAEYGIAFANAGVDQQAEIDLLVAFLRMKFSG